MSCSMSSISDIKLIRTEFYSILKSIFDIYIYTYLHGKGTVKNTTQELLDVRFTID